MAFSVKILGSSSASPAHGRHHSAQFVSVGKHNFLVDCGESTQNQLKKYKCKYSNIQHIFISHLHGDHFFGLIGLISSMHLHGRTASLTVHGPQGLDEIISIQLKHSKCMLGFKLLYIQTNPTEKELLFENKEVEIYSFPLDHRVSCTGFLFQEKEKPYNLNKAKLDEDISLLDIADLKKGLDLFDSEGKIRYKNEELTLGQKKAHSYAYCSDTAFNTRLFDYILGVELLYHESTFTKEASERAKDTGHSTSQQAAEMANLVNAETLILGHFSNRYKDLTIFLEESQGIFPEVHLALEGRSFTYENKGLEIVDF